MFQYKQFIFVYFLFPFEHEMFHRILMTLTIIDTFLCDIEYSHNFFTFLEEVRKHIIIHKLIQNRSMRFSRPDDKHSELVKPGR